jgi:hypothetical protein
VSNELEGDREYPLHLGGDLLGGVWRRGDLLDGARLGGDLLVEIASEGISLVETVGGTYLLTSWCRMRIRCSPNVGGIWSVTDWGSLLFCYILGREIVGFGWLGMLVPDPLAGGSVPRLTTFVVEPCGSGY